MKEAFGGAVVGLLVGGIGGYVAAYLALHQIMTSDTNTVVNHDGVHTHDHIESAHSHDHEHGDPGHASVHNQLEVDDTLPIPALSLNVIPDTTDGVNLAVSLENFAFTPEAVNEANVANTGHGHLYVNDQKIARLYGTWFNIPSTALRPGPNLITVTLNANDHSEWGSQGYPISDFVMYNF